VRIFHVIESRALPGTLPDQCFHFFQCLSFPGFFSYPCHSRFPHDSLPWNFADPPLGMVVLWGLHHLFSSNLLQLVCLSSPCSFPDVGRRRPGLSPPTGISDFLTPQARWSSLVFRCSDDIRILRRPCPRVFHPAFGRPTSSRRFGFFF